MANFLRDLRYALRTLRKTPEFTLAAVLALALGIGVNTAIFSLYNALALRPLPVKDPGRVARLFRTHQGESGAGVFSYPEYVDYRDRSSVLSGLAAWSWTGLTMGTSDRAEQVKAMFVSGNYFDVLGADTAAGRTFIPEEDRTPGSHPVAVLSYRFWERRFARDPATVGRTLLLNGHPFVVVGILAPGFVGTDAEAPEVWVPLMMSTTLAPERGTRIFRERDGHWLQLIGRLKPGVSRPQARAALSLVARQLAQAYPEEKDSAVLLAAATFLPPNVEKAATPILLLVMGAVGLVLLIACANVANLLLARSAARRKEIAVRLSLGATRARLVKQLLAESMVISLLSGTAAIVMAAWGSTVLLRVVQPPFAGALNFDVSPDVRVLGYAFAISMAASLVFGLIPALHASNLRVNELIKTAIQGRRSTWASDAFVVAQVSFCVVLLVAAGLLLRALGRAQTTDPGFETRHVIALSMDLRLRHYATDAAIDFERRAAERVRLLPGVKNASLAAIVPLGTAFMAADIVIEGHEPKSGAPPLIVSQNIVSPEFFETLGIPVLRGRGFEKADWTSAPQIVIVNEAMARRFWPGQEVIGRRIRFGKAKEFAEVVGVVRDTRSSYLWSAGEPYMYTPAKTENNPADLKMLVRTAGAPQTLMAALPGVVRALDPEVQVSCKLLNDNLETWIWPSRAGATLALSFGILAMTLAAVGIYGVVAYAVNRRTHEIGIHVALGAQRCDVLRLVLGHGMLLVGMGAALGLGGALALSRLLAGFLYGVSPADPLTFGAVAVTLACVALAANYIPARRALGVEPVVALRYE